MLIGRLAQPDNAQPEVKLPTDNSGLVGRLADNRPKPIGTLAQGNFDAPIFKIPVIGPVAKGAFDVTKQAFDNTASKFGDLFSSLSAPSIAKDRPIDINQPTGTTIGMTPEQRQDYFDKKLQEGSILNKLVKTGEVGLSLVNFYPPIAQFNAELAAAKNLPGPLSLPAKAIDWGFGKASEFGAGIMAKSIDGYEKAGVISPETATTIKPFSEELASFATLIIGSKVGFKAMEKGLGETANRLPVKPETVDKINKGVQLGVGFSMQPFSTAYGLTQGLLASKIEARRKAGIEITPEEGLKIVNEVKTELPKVIEETKLQSTEQPQVPTIAPVTPKIAPETVVSSETVPKRIETVEQATIPETTGNKVSGVAKSIETKAVEQGLTKAGFDKLAEFEGSTFKEQVAKISELTKDLEKTKRIIKGEEPLPSDIRSGPLLAAMEEYAKNTKDSNLMYQLANSPLTSKISSSASELSFTRMREKDSAMARLAEIKKARESQTGQDVVKLRKEAKESLKAETKKLNLSKEEKALDRFLDKINNLC
jgi:hypothetical protein